MSDNTPEELAAEAGQRGTFNFRERLKGRSYAKDDVIINLDEELGYLLEKLEAAADEEFDDDKKSAIDEKVEQVRAELRKTQYIVHLEGFSNERYDELLALARKSYPFKYEQIINPLTGQKSQQVLPSDDRDELFNRLIWRESIKYVQDSDGNIDENIDDEFVDTLLNSAPQAVLNRLRDTINKLRLATDWIDGTQDEDFLAKP